MERNMDYQPIIKKLYKRIDKTIPTVVDFFKNTYAFGFTKNQQKSDFRRDKIQSPNKNWWNDFVNKSKTGL
jgi:hypothetical protein